MSKNNFESIWEYVDKESSEIFYNGERCWEWTNYLNQDGYGQIRVNYRKYLVHRLSYEIKHGEFNKKLLVCHHCDNRKCVNPNHLFLGTNKDNTQDALRKEKLSHGESHYNSKLSEEDIFKIYKLYEEEGFSQTEISRMFSIGIMEIHRIVSGKRWKISFFKYHSK